MKLLLTITTFVSFMFLTSCASNNRTVASDYCNQSVNNVDHNNYFENYERCKGY